MILDVNDPNERIIIILAIFSCNQKLYIPLTLSEFYSLREVKGKMKEKRTDKLNKTQTPNEFKVLLSVKPNTKTTNREGLTNSQVVNPNDILGTFERNLLFLANSFCDQNLYIPLTGCDYCLNRTNGANLNLSERTKKERNERCKK